MYNEVRNRYIPPQEEMRPQFYYQGSPYENYSPYNVQQMDMKREGYMMPYSPYDNIYTKKYSPYPQGEFVYNTQVDSNSLQNMAASINHHYDGKHNYKIGNHLFTDEEDEELSRLNEKNKKTHVLSDLIGGPVSISPQIYASPSPLQLNLSPNGYPYKSS